MELLVSRTRSMGKDLWNAEESFLKVLMNTVSQLLLFFCNHLLSGNITYPKTVHHFQFSCILLHRSNMDNVGYLALSLRLWFCIVSFLHWSCTDTPPGCPAATQQSLLFFRLWGDLFGTVDRGSLGHHFQFSCFCFKDSSCKILAIYHLRCDCDSILSISFNGHVRAPRQGAQQQRSTHYFFFASEVICPALLTEVLFFDTESLAARRYS